MGGWTIAWTNGALISGLVALAIPYLVHLLTRRTPSTLVFPTVQFLKRAQASQSALFRLRDIVLLFIRTAFIALLLLAFLKPVLRARAMDESVVRRQSAVIIVDASLSMQCNVSSQTPFALAQRAADNLLEKLGGDCVVNVIFAGASTASSLETPAQSVVPLKRDIQNAAPTFERADVDSAIDEAVRQLQSFPEYGQTIYLVSDFQRTNWAAAKFSTVPEAIKLVFLPVNEPAASNIAITNVTLRPRTPVVTETVEVVCTIANYGAAKVTAPVSLQLTRIGAATPSEAASLQREAVIEAGASASVSFRMRATDIGSFEGLVQLPEDALLADNARYFTLDVHDQIDVVVVSDAADEPRASAHFLVRALDPFVGEDAEKKERRGSTLRTRVVRARDLDLDSNPPQVLILDGAGPLGESAARQVAAYVAAGNACIYFLSDALDKSNLDAIAAATKETFVSPFTLTSILYRGAVGEAATFGEANFDEPLLRRFKESRDLAGLQFFRYFGTDRAQGRGQVFLRYDDGNFALGKATLGAGALLLCNFSAGREASDMAQRPVFIPLVYEIVKNMRPREGTASHATVGYTASGAIPADTNATDFMFTTPSGKSIGATSERRGDRLAVILATVREPGFYRVLEGARQLGSIPVNIDARESDLQSLTGVQLEQLAAAPNRKLATAAGRDAHAVGALLDGIPLWHYLLLGALCALGIEQLVLFVLKR